MPLTVTRRKSTGALTISGRVAGQRVQRRGQSDDPKLAQEEAAALEAEILRAAWHGERRDNFTLGVALRSYLEAKPRSRDTQARLRRIRDALGDQTKLRKIDQDTISRLRREVLRPGASSKLGAPTTEAIRAIYDGRLPGFTDFVCYWFENARTLIEAGELTRAGLVATNSIARTQTCRSCTGWRPHHVSSRLGTKKNGQSMARQLTYRWSASAKHGGEACRLNGEIVASINPDLTTGLDLTQAKPLRENKDGAFLGIQKSGPFDVPGELARAWMAEPANPNGHSNAEVLKPYWNGDDVTGRPRDMWFIDLPLGLNRSDAALFASPFAHIANTPDEEGKLVQDLRAALGERAGPRWWEPHWPRPEMRSRIENSSRYIVTPETAQHRLFVWLAYPVLPDKNLIVIPREDDFDVRTAA